MAIILFTIAGFIGMDALLCVKDIGKPRKPLTGGVVAVIVAVDAAIAVALVLAAMLL